VRARLIVKNGTAPGRIFEITEGETIIGRNPSTDVTLHDEGVSREHAVLSWEDGAFTLEDLQSTNGTRVNGKRVRSSPLASGDEIRIGGTDLVFETG
jgi:pSer/pThr/pTyr-binding forkhead associated (FHA) protein